MLKFQIPLYFKQKPILCIAVFLAVLPIHGSLVTAQVIDFEKAAPYECLFTQEQIHNLFNHLQVKPFGREDLAFGFLVPKDWRDIPLTVDAALLENDTVSYVPLTQQLAPSDTGHPRIDVRYNRLDLEVNLADWAAYFVESLDYEVLLKRTAEYNNRMAEDYLIRSVQESVPFIVRLTISRHGNLIFIVTGSAEESVFQEYANIFGLAAVSFTVTNEPKQPDAEPMKQYSGNRSPKLSFRYPASWTVTEPEEIPEGKSGVDLALRLRNPETGTDITMAFVHCKGTLKTVGESSTVILEKMKLDFRNIGVEFVEKMPEMILKERFDQPFTSGELWHVRVGSMSNHLAVVVLEQPTHHVAVSLLVTRREDNRFAWMTGWRVFSLIAADLRGGTGPGTQATSGELPDQSGLIGMVRETLAGLLQAVSSDDYTEFHKTLSGSFKEQAPPDRLRSAFGSFADKKIDISAIRSGEPAFDTPPQIDGNRHLPIDGSFDLYPYQLHFDLEYVFEDRSWKPISISIHYKPSPATEVKPEDIPSGRNLEALVHETMVDFAKAIRAKHFGDFYQKLSVLWKTQTSPEDLSGIFGSFLSQNITLEGIEALTPVSDGEPSIDGNGWLHVAGSYPTQPMKTYFTFQYLREKTSWKLTSININMK